MLQPHPAAELFPLMEGAEFDALVQDIRANGLVDPVIVHGGLILDGRNRHRACQEIGIEPMTKEWDGKGNPVTFVVSKNLHRRHLNESQRAMIAGRLANLKPSQHAEQSKKSAAAGIPAAAPVTQGQAAEMLNVSRGSVQEAATVLNKGTEEEKQAVMQGKAAVSTVARAIRRGDAPEKRKAAIATGWTDVRGRRMPERPTAECMERGIDQLSNSLDALEKIIARPDANSHPQLHEWISAMEKSRTALTRLINNCRSRRVA
jgi:hypothetical protein